MGRAPCCDKNGLKKGPWTQEEDQKLIHFIRNHGCGNWRTLPKNAGLQRCGKSCRLRWTNYLRPDIKRGRFSLEEEETIIQLHSILGNKWSAIASRLPGRTDNEIKNYWNTHIRKRLLRMGIDPVTHTPRLDLLDLSSLLTLSYLYNYQSSLMMTNPELLTPIASNITTVYQNHHSLSPNTQNGTHQYLESQQVICNNTQISQVPLADNDQVQQIPPCPSYHDEPQQLSQVLVHHQYPSNHIMNNFISSQNCDQLISCGNMPSSDLFSTQELMHVPDHGQPFYESTSYNNYEQNINHFRGQPLCETLSSTNFHSNNVISNQDLSFTSVLSTPSSSLSEDNVQGQPWNPPTC